MKEKVLSLRKKQKNTLVWGGDRFCTVKNLEEDAGKADE